MLMQEISPNMSRALARVLSDLDADKKLEWYSLIASGSIKSIEDIPDWLIGPAQKLIDEERI